VKISKYHNFPDIFIIVINIINVKRLGLFLDHPLYRQWSARSYFQKATTRKCFKSSFYGMFPHIFTEEIWACPPIGPCPYSLSVTAHSSRDWR